MRASTLIILACLIAVVVSAYVPHPEQIEALEPLSDTPTHDSSSRSKRGLLLLKKKLLLGALGLKAVKVGAVGVAGALALKSKAGHKHPETTIEVHSKHPIHHPVGVPHSFVEVHDWSG